MLVKQSSTVELNLRTKYFAGLEPAHHANCSVAVNEAACAGVAGCRMPRSPAFMKVRRTRGALNSTCDPVVVDL